MKPRSHHHYSGLRTTCLVSDTLLDHKSWCHNDLLPGSRCFWLAVECNVSVTLINTLPTRIIIHSFKGRNLIGTLDLMQVRVHAARCHVIHARLIPSISKFALSVGIHVQSAIAMNFVIILSVDMRLHLRLSCPNRTAFHFA